MTYTKIKVGNYLVIGEGNEWNVMEQFGSYRMLKKKYKTPEKAVAGATEMNVAYTSKK